MLLRTVLTLGLLHTGQAAAQFAYANNQVTVDQDEDHVASNFPEVAGVELYSPSFVSPDTVPGGFTNGTSGPTDEATLDNFLRSLAARNDWLTYHNPDFKSEEGRSIPYVYLSTSKQGPSSQDTSGKLRIWMQGGVHGNEPAGDQGLLALLGKLDSNATWAASVLERADILVLPRYNPDGVAYFQRYLATNFDPNRDHTKLARQQTRDIKQLMVAFAPHVGVDCHEYSAARHYGARDQWLPSQDGQFSAMKNLNIHRNIRALAEGVFANAIAAAMESRGLRWSPYITADPGTDDVVMDETTSDAKIGDTSVALTQAVMFLFETRGIMLAAQHWQRRVATQLTMLEALVQTAVDRADEVLETVESARADFIASGEDIVVTDYGRPTNISWTYVDAESGDLVDIPVTFRNSTPLSANLTRARPEAYVFSRAWADVAERLRVAGVRVDTLDSGFRGEVEAFNVTRAEVASSKYEGVARTTVATETSTKELSLPAGAFWVSTRQKNAAHAFVTLEPEGIDSYATFNILTVDVGDEYQVYRVMASG